MKKVNIYPIPLGLEYSGLSVYPLGLLTAYAKVWKDGWLNNYFQFNTIELYLMEDLDKILSLAEKNEKAIFLFSSYTWIFEDIIVVAKMLREKCPEALIVVGGPMVPSSGLAIMNEWHCFDIAVYGEGEQTFVEMLEAITERALIPDQPMRFTNLSGIKGLLWRKPDMCSVRNDPQPRIIDVNILPSPYLTNLVSADNAQKATTIYTETNRGCPFGCTFCDWGGNTMSKFRCFNIDRVLQEIEWCGVNKVETFFLADSNFGAFKRDLDIVKYLVATNKKYGYPQRLISSFAKNVTNRVAEIIELLHANGMTDRAAIAFQTTDQQTLNNIARGNIKTSRFDDLVVRLKRKNVPILTELIVGLPGQTYETFKYDLQYFFDRVVHPMVYELIVLPNAPMAEKAYMDKFSIKLNDDRAVISTVSFDQVEYARMIELRIVSWTLLHEKFVRYFLYYFQAQYQLKALDVVEEIITHGHSNADTYPKLKWLVNHMSHRDMTSLLKPQCLSRWYDDAVYVLEDLADFYREFIAFIEEKFHVVGDSSEIDALTKLQMLMIDRVNKTFPAAMPVAHNVNDYFFQFTTMTGINDPENIKNFRPLKSYPPTVLQVPAEQKKKRQYSFSKTTHDPEWPVSVVGLPL